MDNTKFFTEKEFSEKGIVYAFTLYAKPQDAHLETNGKEVIIWQNNNLTISIAQCILMGIVSGAGCKYKHPKAILYAIDCNGNKKRLSSCIK